MPLPGVKGRYIPTRVPLPGVLQVYITLQGASSGCVTVINTHQGASSGCVPLRYMPPSSLGRGTPVGMGGIPGICPGGYGEVALVYARVYMVGIQPPYHGAYLPPRVYHHPVLHLGPAHPAAHDGRVRDDGALGSRREGYPGWRPLSVLKSSKV